MPAKPKDPVIRYRAKVDVRGPDECWLWTASCYRNGYGQFGISKEQRSVLAHRFGYSALKGPIPPGQNVLHTCDNPPCQNPAHWYLGSQKNNADDRETRNRGNHPHGERNNAKLTEGDVEEIRRLYSLGAHRQEIAKQFNISERNVYQVARGERWTRTSSPRPVVTRRRDGHPKLTDEDVREIRRLRAAGQPLRAIAEQFSVTMSNVSQIARRTSRADVQDLPATTIID